MGQCGCARVMRFGQHPCTDQCRRRTRTCCAVEHYFTPAPIHPLGASLKPGNQSRYLICAKHVHATQYFWLQWKSPAFARCLLCLCSKRVNWLGQSLSIARRYYPSQISRSNWCKTSPRKLSSPSRTRGCSTNCANRCNSKQRQQMCSRSSAAPPSTYKQCLIRWSSRRLSSVKLRMHLFFCQLGTSSERLRATGSHLNFINIWNLTHPGSIEAVWSAELRSMRVSFILPTCWPIWSTPGRTRQRLAATGRR